MSHATHWTCRACGFLLGHVRGGVLYPAAAVRSVDGRGVIRVPCPECARVRVWFPAGAAPAVPGDRRPPDRPG